MRPERYSTSYAQISAKPLIQRGFTVLLVITGVTLLLLARAGNPVVTHLRARILDAVTPATEWLSQPVTALRDLIHDKNELLNAFAENQQLHAENDALRHWQAVAQSLKAENDSLRALAGYDPVTHASYITARVTGQSPSGYAATVTLNVGAADGIKPLQPVIDAYGILGRVTDVGEHTAKVLLLSDSTSRIPVIAATTRQHAILAGTGAGDELLRLTFLGGDSADIALGDQITTTEEGGLIPGGIIVGTVFRRDSTGLLVKPIRPLAQSEYVRVVVAK